MKNMLKKLVALFAVGLFMIPLTSCGQENKYVRVGVSENIEGLNLYLTGKGSGKQSVSTYVYFGKGDSYADDVIEYMLEPRGVDIAYFDIKDLNKVAQHKELHVVYIDSFNADGSVKGIWVARDKWINNCPNYFPKYIKGLVQSADYRASNSSMYATYSEAYAAVKKAHDNDEIYLKSTPYTEKNNIHIQTDTFEYCALYELDNIKDADKAYFETYNFTVKDLDYYTTVFAGEVKDAEKKTYTLSKTAPGYLALRAYYELAITGSDKSSFENLFMLDEMVTQTYAVKNTVTTTKKKDSTTAIIIIVSAAALVITAAVLFFIFRKKSDKPLLDVKEVLDVK